MPELYGKIGSTQRRAQLIYGKIGAAQRPVRSIYLKAGGHQILVYSSVIEAVIATTQADLIARNALLLAGWDGVSVINGVVRVNPGVLLFPSDRNHFAIDSGPPLPAGSTLSFIIGGIGIGYGGRGGTGALGISIASTPGENGTPAVRLQMPASFDCSIGNLFGGGGGGGGGGSANASCGVNKGATDGTADGGGGGGGAGDGPAGVGAFNGTQGTRATPTGAQGAYGAGNTGACSTVGGRGGMGGDWGQDGEAGISGNVGGLPASPGGVHGAAIQSNGHAVTIIGGLSHIIGGII